MLLLGVNEDMDKLYVVDSVHWYGLVLSREDGHVLRRSLKFEVEV